MAKIKQDRELLKIIDDYKTFINAEKRINAPIIVSEPKGNHGTSLYTKKHLHSEFHFGNTFMTCEVRNGDKTDCSFQIVSDKFKKGVVIRYDSGGGTHKNEVPFIPLARRCV